MRYNKDYIQTFNADKPLDRDELRVAIIVTIVSGLITLITGLLNLLPIAILSGVVCFVCLWLFVGDFIKRVQDRRRVSSSTPITKEEMYRYCSWKIDNHKA